jgi:hypothetical protein
LPGILSAGFGFLALRAAERSAARGGGLLGSFGIFPLTTGLAMVLLSIGSIALALTVVPKPKGDAGRRPMPRRSVADRAPGLPGQKDEE